jgi:hypothetical protein
METTTDTIIRYLIGGTFFFGFIFFVESIIKL